MISYSKTIRKNPINPTAPKKTYAVAQVRETLSLDDFAKHISDHNAKYNRADVAAVLTYALDCMTEQIKLGNAINLGRGWCTFLPVLKCRGVCESIVDNLTGEKPVFGVDDIVGVSVRWNKGKELRNFREGCTFEETLTREEKRKAHTEKNTAIADGTFKPLGAKEPGVSEID